VVGVPGDGVNRRSFIWRDGERVIAFGRGRAAEAVELAGGPGFALLTTERALAAAPALAGAAAVVHHVGQGTVPPLAAAALDALPPGDGRYVALGGGRVVDVAKAVAAARGAGARALAVPTTLSGAELTSVHRHAEGVDESTPRVRCALVVTDPALAASQPEEELAASALNALAHATEAPCTVAANPVSTLAAHEAARLLVAGLGRDVPDRDALALGALLAGYAMDSTGYGLHHVLAQTLVQRGLTSHGRANAVLLPHTLAALAWRRPAQLAALEAALGEDPADAAARLCPRTGAVRLRDLGIDEPALDAAADAAAARPQLAHTPPPADRAELRAIYAAAW
jgi:alcohol dehydrogenase class IV